MEIVYTSGFLRMYKKLPKDVKIAFEKRGKIFCENPFNPVLDTHKLHGRLRNLWSFSLGYKYRIIFEFVGKQTVHFYAVGDHEVYG